MAQRKPKMKSGPEFNKHSDFIAKPPGDDEVDHLVVDPKIPGQRYVVFSWINPKDRVRDKQIFYVNRFMVDDINETLVAQARHMATKLRTEFNNNVSSVLSRLEASVEEADKQLFALIKPRMDDLRVDVDKYVEECSRQYTFDREELDDKFSVFLTEKRTELDDIYDESQDRPWTDVRGIKVRGTYDDAKEARARAKLMTTKVEPDINTVVMPVGRWCPLDMEIEEIPNQEHQIKDLNKLMGAYYENVSKRNEFFAERRRQEAGDGRAQDISEQYQHPRGSKEARLAAMKKKIAAKKALRDKEKAKKSVASTLGRR